MFLKFLFKRWEILALLVLELWNLALAKTESAKMCGWQYETQRSRL